MRAGPAVADEPAGRAALFAGACGIAGGVGGLPRRVDTGSMDLSNPAAILSGLAIGLLGLAIFRYGKKEASPRCLVVGAVLCIFPYFVTSLAMMWLITGGCVGGLWVMSRQG